MSKRSGVGKVMGRAARGPLNLSVLGGAVIGAVALMSWPIAAIGGVAYAALVASDVSNPDFRRRILFGRGAPAKLPKPETLKDPTVRGIVESILAARVEIDGVVKATPERVQRNVRTAIASLDELESHGAALAVRAEDIAAYLRTVDVSAVTAEVAQHTKRARAATDPGVKKDYELAASAGEERRKAIADISVAQERTLANLEKIASTFKSIPAKLVRLRALDDQASDALTGDVGSELERMNVDLRSFEQTLESIVEVNP
ncbi:MAG: hypothetical protein ABI175_03355 [Polyangiales bacterium]